MKEKLLFVMMVGIILLACAALFWGGSYAAFLLAYVFAFGFLFCCTAFSAASALEKVKQLLVYALIMAAQIVFAVLILRTLLEGGMTDGRLGKLAGAALIFVPFLVRRCVFQNGSGRE